MGKRKERTEKNRIFPRELIRQCLKENNLRDGKSIEDFLKASFGEFIQGALEAEMDAELGYTRYDYKEKEGTNSRNGHHKKTIRTDMGNVELQIPQDTDGEFEPQIVPKHSRTVSRNIQDAVLSMYAKECPLRI